MMHIDINDLKDLNETVSNNYNLKDTLYYQLYGTMLYILDKMSADFTYCTFLDEIERIFRDIELDGLNEHNTESFFELLEEVTR